MKSCDPQLAFNRGTICTPVEMEAGDGTRHAQKSLIEAKKFQAVLIRLAQQA